MAIVERGNMQGQARGRPQADTEETRSEERREHHQQAPVKERPEEDTAATLLDDPRTRRWMWRIGVAVVAGLAVLLVFGWRLGVTVAVLVVIGDVVRQSRKSSSVTAWQKSSAAERRTERQLKSLQRNGYLVLHARAVPRDDEGVSDGRIDHLVIGPSGVYAIDSEKWDKRLPVRTMSHLKLFHGPFNKKDRLDEARWEAQQASSILGERVGFDVPVQPSVAIYGPSIPWKVMRVREVDVYAGNRARSYLRRRPKILTDGDVRRIFQAAEQALPPKYPE
ncbi:nuclease-related domain-containing protein [Actinomadura madurae]|uniref:Nuclease-related domain-containing protein n=1 Tax=Actinomadura madurae TaxID=1993 RepID=A0A1I5KXI2_9ACTN|nr:nuclease-related domain-containing protein [Actinomadura madurae]SFO89784.1 Nuclease-related domain-containing protein [Actinomadura madurae]SPT49327.1 Nuclease-related domain [Actinomadura madurae]